jgi:hypothetical protein
MSFTHKKIEVHTNKEKNIECFTHNYSINMNLHTKFEMRRKFTQKHLDL